MRRTTVVATAWVAALVIAAGITSSEAPAKRSKTSRPTITEIAIADAPVAKGGRIGVEVSARYRPAVTPGAAGFRHRLVARVKARVGGRTFSAKPGADANLKDLRLSTSPTLARHHLFFSSADSRRIRSARMTFDAASSAEFLATVTDSVDTNQDGTSDASASDTAMDDTPQVLTSPSSGSQLGDQVPNPCYGSIHPDCMNVPSLPKATTHFWDQAKLSPNCPAGTSVVEAAHPPDNPDPNAGQFVYHITVSPANRDEYSQTSWTPNVYIVDWNSHHPATWTVTFACSIDGR
jgi:hypothetical protein